ncbi:CAP domain-containing protein [Candidatus Synechococcus calcipolaris G9]|uniref:CAP domain-containing protein n=1 Tax=Candidatus Synechococcus calcipolaris G9 TaxID=1497997 RepID=A0ABT6EVK9_9SYNE|nr:CAP domain-containing protein [Candidatus Synechococcus calcipolaris]MDG2989422.1 CAP domain-containing protein [Candidatus Synechococcus calcipolaris G9]
MAALTFFQNIRWVQSVSRAVCTLALLLMVDFISPATGENSLYPHCRGRDILTAPVCRGDQIDPEEQNLYTLINEYRDRHGLPPIPLSPALNQVANRHILDLVHNVGYLTHGWSDCPYHASQPATYACMWNAPQRLGTTYPGNGYENAYEGPRKATATGTLATWQQSHLHRAVILNEGIWATKTWQALGIGIYEKYAVVWFGEEVD